MEAGQFTVFFQILEGHRLDPGERVGDGELISVAGQHRDEMSHRPKFHSDHGGESQVIGQTGTEIEFRAQAFRADVAGQIPCFGAAAGGERGMRDFPLGFLDAELCHDRRDARGSA